MAGNGERGTSAGIEKTFGTLRTSSYVTQCSCLLRSEEIFRDFRTFSAHFPGFSHIFRTFSVVFAIFRTFPEKILSYPHTVLKFWYKNRFVSRKPPAAHVPRAERQERHPPPVTFRTHVPAEENTFPTLYDSRFPIEWREQDLKAAERVH